MHFLLFFLLLLPSSIALSVTCNEFLLDDPLDHFDNGLIVHKSILKELLSEVEKLEYKDASQTGETLTLAEAVAIDEWMVGDLNQHESSSPEYREVLNRGINKLPIISGVFYRIETSLRLFNLQNIKEGDVIKLKQPYGLSVTRIEDVSQSLLHGPFADPENYMGYRFEDSPPQVLGLYIIGTAQSLSEFYEGNIKTVEGNYKPEVAKVYSEEAEAHLLPGKKLLVEKILRDPLTGWFSLIITATD